MGGWKLVRALQDALATRHVADRKVKIEQNRDLQTSLFDPLGAQGWLRPNWLHPPFNNKKARQALLHMMDQVTYLAYAIGESQYYRACPSVFACGGPYQTRIGAAPMVEHNLATARELVKESGYDGQPIVVAAGRSEADGSGRSSHRPDLTPTPGATSRRFPWPTWSRSLPASRRRFGKAAEPKPPNRSTEKDDLRRASALRD